MTYEEDLKPLTDVIELVYDLHISPSLKVLYSKYKETFLGTDTSKSELIDIIKPYIEQVLNLLSKDYNKTVLQKYFSKEGIVQFILFVLLSKIKEGYSMYLQAG